LDKIEKRLKSCKLELHPEKTKIVYCKDSNRKEKYKYTEFTFLGYTFRGRRTKSPQGRMFKSFTPAATQKAIKKMFSEIRAMWIHQRINLSIKEIAQLINPKVRGWVNYYGKFHKRSLSPFLFSLNCRVIKWIRHKYKGFQHGAKGAERWLKQVEKANPDLFVHWSFGFRI
jgi:RNA-directed DNA polymerase